MLKSSACQHHLLITVGVVDRFFHQDGDIALFPFFLKNFRCNRLIHILRQLKSHQDWNLSSQYD